jgi:hypothetical protein
METFQDQCLEEELEKKIHMVYTNPLLHIASKKKKESPLL